MKRLIALKNSLLALLTPNPTQKYNPFSPKQQLIPIKIKARTHYRR
ncbi:MAG: hypothetical protein KAG28_09600 [Cocleimonas sp.]|nr:hypothetical protein [Cocleimonas sp.]